MTVQVVTASVVSKARGYKKWQYSFEYQKNQKKRKKNVEGCPEKDPTPIFAPNGCILLSQEQKAHLLVTTSTFPDTHILPSWRGDLQKS